MSWVDVVYRVFRKQSPIYTIFYLLSVPWIVGLTIRKVKPAWYKYRVAGLDSDGHRVFLDSEGRRVKWF